MQCREEEGLSWLSCLATHMCSPSVKWAQREDKLFITINLTSCKDPKFELEPEGKFAFR